MDMGIIGALKNRYLYICYRRSLRFMSHAKWWNRN